MKTPREILFECHQQANPKLNRIRRDVVGQIAEGVFEEGATVENEPPFFLKVWMELLLPARRVWLGLAGAWGLILTLSILAAEDPGSATTGAPPSRETIVLLREQQRLMAQLLGESADPPEPAIPAKPKHSQASPGSPLGQTSRLYRTA